MAVATAGTCVTVGVGAGVGVGVGEIVGDGDTVGDITPSVADEPKMDPRWGRGDGEGSSWVSGFVNTVGVWSEALHSASTQGVGEGTGVGRVAAGVPVALRRNQVQ